MWECHCWVQSEFKASLGYMRFFFLKKKSEKQELKNVTKLNTGYHHTLFRIPEVLGEMRRRGTLLHTTGDNRNFHSCYRKQCGCLKNEQIELPYDSTIPLLSVYLREMNSVC